MRPVYVCQLPDKMQEELRGILERILLYHCGSVEKAEEYFGTSLEEAVQNGMDSKIVDVDCVIDSLWSGGELASDAPVEVQNDALRLLMLIKESRTLDVDDTFLYAAKQKSDEGQMYETVHAVHCYGENDFSFWQVTIPLYMVRNILNSAENDTGTMADILDRLPRGSDPEGTTFHFLFPRGDGFARCSMGNRITQGMASEIAYAKEHHIPIFEIEHPEEKEFYPISADENQLLGRHSCEPDSQEQNYEGKILVMNYDALKEEYRSRPFQLWLATGGFGCSPSARGRRVFATNMYDGEQTSFYRQDFAGIVRKEVLEEVQKQYQFGYTNQESQSTSETEEEGIEP